MPRPPPEPPDPGNESMEYVHHTEEIVTEVNTDNSSPVVQDSDNNQSDNNLPLANAAQLNRKRKSISSSDNLQIKKHLAPRFYNTNSKGPFETIIASKLGVKVHTLKVGRLLQENRVGLQQANPIGKNVSVTFQSPSIANDFVKKCLHNPDFDVYIPQNRVQVSGVIRLETDIDETTIFSDISSSARLLRVRRMNLRKPADSTSSAPIPSQNVVLQFEGTSLPKYVYFNCIRIEVRPYIQPVLQCYNCLRFGHTAKACKGKVRCRYCTNNHESSTCLKKSSPICVFCSGGHDSSHKSCPELQRQKDIKIRMAFQGESFAQASKACPINYKTYENTPRTYAAATSTLYTTRSLRSRQEDGLATLNRFELLSGDEDNEDTDFPRLPNPATTTRYSPRRPRRQHPRLFTNIMHKDPGNDTLGNSVSSVHTLTVADQSYAGGSLPKTPNKRSLLQKAAASSLGETYIRKTANSLLKDSLVKRIHSIFRRPTLDNTEIYNDSVFDEKIEEIAKACVALMQHPVSEFSDISDTN